LRRVARPQAVRGTARSDARNPGMLIEAIVNRVSWT
jgi:hypothetical protein